MFGADHLNLNVLRKVDVLVGRFRHWFKAIELLERGVKFLVISDLVYLLLNLCLDMSLDLVSDHDAISLLNLAFLA